MNLTDRDKKIVLILAPVLLVAAVWFLLISPKRQEASTVGDQLSKAEAKRDDATNQLNALRAAKGDYAKDYAAVVRMGKAVPSSLDMPSLIIQLQEAAHGSHIDFASIKPGDRTDATSSAAAGGSTSAPAGGTASSSTPSSGTASSGASGSSSSSPPVAAGGQQAQTGPGKAAENANGAAAKSDQANQSAGADAGTANSGSAATTGGATSPTAPGLDSVPLQFTFNGSFFDLADFFHRMKRFVRAANDDLQVKGRLMTLDQVNFDSTNFPALKASVNATVYLSPKDEGTTAGGTSAGPSATQSTSTPSSATSGSTTPTGGTQ